MTWRNKQTFTSGSFCCWKFDGFATQSRWCGQELETERGGVRDY